MSTHLELKDLGASVSAAVDRARHGEEVTISEQGRPVAKIVSVDSPSQTPVLGSMRGMVEMTHDFNDPLHVDELREWENCRSCSTRARSFG